MLAVVLVYLIAGAGRGPADSLLLAGATVSALCAAVVWLLSAAFQDSLPKLMGWVMGGLNLNTDHWKSLTVAGPLVLLGGSVLSLLGRPLDALRAGDDTARALGLPVGVVLPVVLAAGSVAVAAAVATGGVIGFVGLVAPHVARPLVGAAHSRLIPTAALVGAMLLVPADLLARSVAPPRELPLGAITALAGGPVFLVLLRTTTRRRVAA
jgi:iron complex transport system permease protein